MLVFTTKTSAPSSIIKFLISQNEVKTISIEDMLKKFFDKLKLNNQPGTIKGYKACLKQPLRYLRLRRIYKCHEITTDIINDYISYRLENVKNITINKEIKALKTMLNYAVELEYLDKMPFKFKKLKEEKPKIDSIKMEDINKIIKYFSTTSKDHKNILAFMLIFTTGIRTTELINIKNDNIDLKNKRILLQFTKNGKDRYIYIVDELIDLVREVMSDNTYLFNDKYNVQMSDNSLRCFFKHIKKELSIDTLSPHKLRHLYATTIYNNSLDIYLTSNLLGHSDIKITQIYLDINEDKNQLKNELYNPLQFLDPLII